MDLTLEGKLFRNGTFEQGCLGIEQGKIVAIKKVLKAEHHINVGTSVLLPAGIDLHVHFRDPGFPHKEDFATGSMAAAFGGLSCVCDMPNTQPHTTSVQTIKEKIHIATEKSYTDFGLYAAVTDENIGRLADIAPSCIGFKIFLGSSINSLQLSSQNLRVGLLEINRMKKITLLHAEDEHCLAAHAGPEQTLIDHLRCRPAECEETAIRTILNASQGLSTPIHICHLSSCEGFEMLRRKPPQVSVGVTPHHLLFDVHTVNTNQSWYKVNPPIRSSYDRDLLRYGLQNGFIDVLESDHAPHTLEEKNQEFNDAPSGLPGVETTYPLFLAMVKKEQMALSTLLSCVCEQPAQLLKIPKGKLEVGFDADVLVVDMKQTNPVTLEQLHSKCGWTPYEGFPAIFPTTVFIRGERVIDDHQLLGKQGFGTPIGV
jgi:dihydroorotase